MTLEEEVLELVEKGIGELKIIQGMFNLSAWYTIQQALRKTVPQKAKKHMDGMHECPECGAPVMIKSSTFRARYCYHCGQAIDAEREEEMKI